jgi:hypothetical protein
LAVPCRGVEIDGVKTHAATPDGPPSGGGKPFVVFLAPAQFEALMLQAEDEGEEPGTLVRRAIRLSFWQAAQADVAHTVDL